MKTDRTQKSAKINPTTKGTDVGRSILSAISISGSLALASIQPSLVKLMPLLGIGRRRYYLNTAFIKLVKKGWIEIKNNEGKKYCIITKSGKNKLARLEIRQYRSVLENSKKKWDGKWRLVIFDISEYGKYARNRLRLELLALGFVKLQNSVWVYPYDCEDLIFLFKTSFELGGSVLYITAEKIENDRHLREHFSLI